MSDLQSHFSLHKRSYWQLQRARHSKQCCRSGLCRCSGKKIMFWKGNGGSSQMASWRITGIFGNPGYSCVPKLFGASALYNVLIFCICLCVLVCLNHKVVNSMGRKWRETTSSASMCVQCMLLAGWEPHGNLRETVEKGFQALFAFSLFSCSINIPSVRMKFSKLGVFFAQLLR